MSVTTPLPITRRHTPRAPYLRRGLSGALEVDGETWDAEMPAFGATPEDMASLLTYVRREWGHGADPFARAFIEGLCEQVGDWVRPFTTEDLGIGRGR